MVEFSELQRAHDRIPHPDSDSKPGFRIERNKIGQNRFRVIIGPEGETLTVRKTGNFHVFIDNDGLDSTLDQIMIECFFDDAWQPIKDAANESYAALCHILNDIENRGAAALQGGGNG